MVRFPDTRKMSLKWITRPAFALVSLVSCLPVASAQPERSGLTPDQQLLLNLQKEIVDHSIYKPQTADVVTGALGALQRDLGEGYAGFFPQDVPQKPGQALATFMEVTRAIASSPRGTAEGFTVFGLIERSFGAYCRTLDPYSDYIDSGSARKLEELSNPHYIGVGITFRKVREGFFCRPFEGSAADRSGVLEDDELLAVNGEAVAKMSLLEVVSRVSGAAETMVALRVRHKTGVIEELKILRESVKSKSIEVSEARNGVSIFVRRIDEEGFDELKSVIKALRPNLPVTLDFRGCGGGDLELSVAIAELFLPANSLIVRLETRTGKETLLSRNKAPYATNKLLVLQDGFTASGAELIIAALQGSPKLRVESRGAKSFGKGLVQRQIQVVRGGILEISEAKMYGPQGEFWDGSGLQPSSKKAVDAPF